MQPARPDQADAVGRQPRSALALVAMSVGALLLFSAFVALGTWQVQRRAWKLDLIARVEQRVHAPPVAAPPQSQWSQVTAANSEYRHVRAAGTYLNESETLVQATTELGAGFWVLTPLRLADGSVILVNRGFVPPEKRDRLAHRSSNRAVSEGTPSGGEGIPSGDGLAHGASGLAHGAGEATALATVTGLLRMTEPGGGFLRGNDPGANRWYSRDVQAIAAARGLSRVAPYFIDADAAGGEARTDGASGGSGPDGMARAADGRSAGAAAAPAGGDTATVDAAPVGGLTVITFHNSHLVYVITWYTLALMVVGGMWIVIREERRLRREAGAPGGRAGVGDGAP